MVQLIFDFEFFRIWNPKININRFLINLNRTIGTVVRRKLLCNSQSTAPSLKLTVWNLQSEIHSLKLSLRFSKSDSQQVNSAIQIFQLARNFSSSASRKFWLENFRVKTFEWKRLKFKLWIKILELKKTFEWKPLGSNKFSISSKIYWFQNQIPVNNRVNIVIHWRLQFGVYKLHIWTLRESHWSKFDSNSFESV